ncbi:MAG: hypothetical protein HY237_03155 [Acidobacteria bacterium]|nr:hypothetical protein [Acidobacteriota bacterium]
MRVHSLSVPGQWGADISPDGRAVAVAKLHKDTSSSTKQEEVYVEIEVWDFRANKRLAQRALAHRPAVTPVTTEWGQVRYTSDGQRLLVYDGELLSVLKAADLDEITRIDLGLPAWPRDSQVVDLALARDATRQVAVLLSWGGGRGGALRLYNLHTGKLDQQWEWDHGYPELGARVAWRPDGKRVAVTLLPVILGEKIPKEEPGLEVTDAESGQVLQRIHTGYLAGPLCFTSDDRLVAATAEPAWTMLLGTHKIKIWRASTGHLLREIESPPSGARASLALSADEKLLLGYVGSEKSATSLAAADPTEITEQKFREWDLATGKVVATSPKMQPNPGKRAHLRMSAKGNLVLVFWEFPDRPLLVYEIE